MHKGGIIKVAKSALPDFLSAKHLSINLPDIPVVLNYKKNIKL